MKNTETTNARLTMKELEMIAAGKAVTEYFHNKPITILNARAYGGDKDGKPQIRIYAYDNYFCWQLTYTTDDNLNLTLFEEMSGIMDVQPKDMSN